MRAFVTWSLTLLFMFPHYSCKGNQSRRAVKVSEHNVTCWFSQMVSGPRRSPVATESKQARYLQPLQNVNARLVGVGTERQPLDASLLSLFDVSPIDHEDMEAVRRTGGFAGMAWALLSPLQPCRGKGLGGLRVRAAQRWHREGWKPGRKWKKLCKH
ncbi:unnamed protein product [Symbiodinium sp. CCMP2592]|nr:unnamed protein product [Symbiodinium sp. CCMP2592]